MILLLVACAPKEEEPVDPGTPVAPLVLPDVSDVDLPTAYADALALALGVRTSAAWAGHVATLGMATPGCPDFWAGAPEDELEVDEDAGGMSWADYCEGSGVGFSGAAWWGSSASVTGDASTVEGAITTGERSLVADAVVGDGPDVRFEFDGEASDSVSVSEAPGYAHWTWSSLLAGTVTGTEVFTGSQTPGGYRADLYLEVSGGDVDLLTARGNLYLFDDRLAERFDSVAMDLSYQGELGAGPDACTLEPTGWISLRDTNAYWYDLVFLPLDGDADPAACDGCGDLYLRGVAAGQVCVDLSSTWDGRLAPPDIADFVLSLHDLP